MHKSKTWALLAGIMVFSLILAACAPQQVEVPVTVVVKETQEVTVVETQVVQQTEIVEVEKKSFTTPHPILGDLKVRQAIAHCTNKLDLIKSVYPLVPEDQQAGLVMNTFIPTSSWAYAGDDNITIYEFDPAGELKCEPSVP